jgi:16S rRNA (guanine527-N7)-methyltransferase
MNDEQHLKAVLLDLQASTMAIAQFRQYHDLLCKWNRRVNLISKHDEIRIVRRHFIESLGLLHFARIPLQARLLDLGTGAGFPGIPIKLCRPDIHLVLVEANRKKGLFLNHLIHELNLSDVRVIIGRAEQPPEEKPVVKWVISRAVSDAVTLVEWSTPYLHPTGGRIILLKSPDAQNELNYLPDRISALRVMKSRHVTFVPFPDCLPAMKQSLIEIILKKILINI